MYGQPNTHRIQTATIADDGTLSDAVKISDANRVLVECPVWASFCTTIVADIELSVQLAQSSGGTFRRLITNSVTSASSGYVTWTALSFPGNAFVDVPVAGVNYMKVEINHTASAAIALPIHIIT